MMDLVSIIIPVYNGEKTLKNALESVVNQTYKNIEVILINDGSTDNSLMIMNNYKKKYHKFKFEIIDKINEGQAAARNDGLKKSNGKYIQFLDCDDTLELDAIETLINIAKENEFSFILFGFNIYRDKKLLRKPNSGNTVVKIEDGYKEFQKIEKLMESVCNKFYKKDYIKYQFDTNRVFGEDGIFNYNNLDMNTIVLSIEKSLYNVQLGTSDSVNKRYKKGKIIDIIFSRKNKIEKLRKLFDLEVDENKFWIKELNTISHTAYMCEIKLGYSKAKEELMKIDKEFNQKYLCEIYKLKKHANIKTKIIIHFLEKKQFINLFIISKIIYLIRK